MNEQEFKKNTFKVLGMIADIYYQNSELKKHFDLWITESTENGSDQISLTIKEKEEVENDTHQDESKKINISQNQSSDL